MIGWKFDIIYIIREQNNCKYTDCLSLIHAFLIKKTHQFHPFLCAKSLLTRGWASIRAWASIWMNRVYLWLSSPLSRRHLWCKQTCPYKHYCTSAKIWTSLEKLQLNLSKESPVIYMNLFHPSTVCSFLKCFFHFMCLHWAQNSCTNSSTLCVSLVLDW